MGFSIALTGLVASIFGVVVGFFAVSPPKNIILGGICGWLMIIGVWAIPIGLIIQIWQ